MTFIKHSVGVFLAILFLVSCSKEKSIEGKDFSSDFETLWEFTEGDILFNGKMDSAESQSLTDGVEVLTAAGSESADAGTPAEIILQIAGSQIAIGEYRNPDIFFQYMEDGAVLFQNSPLDAMAFTISVSEIDSVSVSGTFSGEVKDAEGTTRIIEDGKFRVKFAGGVTGTGPDPNLDYLPLHAVWTYGNADDFENDTLAINSVGDTLANGKQYRKFLNSASGETKYYRKEDGVYYEFVTNFAGFPLEPPMEQVILMDGSADNSWETEPYQFTFGSGGSGPVVAVTAKLKRKIMAYNFSATMNGVIYHNLIEVQTRMFVKEPGDADFEDSGSSYTTLFAKGVGIVSYVDLAGESIWNIRHYNTHD